MELARRENVLHVDLRSVGDDSRYPYHGVRIRHVSHIFTPVTVHFVFANDENKQNLNASIKNASVWFER